MGNYQKYAPMKPSRIDRFISYIESVSALASEDQETLQIRKKDERPFNLLNFQHLLKANRSHRYRQSPL